MNFFFTSVAGFNVTVIYKNGFMRKFLFFALSAIFTAGTPAGCNTDYNAISYFVWVNDSDHKITLFVESDLGCEFKNDDGRSAQCGKGNFHRHRERVG